MKTQRKNNLILDFKKPFKLYLFIYPFIYSFIRVAIVPNAQGCISGCHCLSGTTINSSTEALLCGDCGERSTFKKKSASGTSSDRLGQQGQRVNPRLETTLTLVISLFSILFCTTNSQLSSWVHTFTILFMKKKCDFLYVRFCLPV